MPPTVIRGTQVLDGSIQRTDLDVSTAGQAVVAKIVQGTNVTLSSTGTDSGTGDVTISVLGGTSHYYDYDEFMNAGGPANAKFTFMQNSAGSGAVSTIQASTPAIPYGFVQLSPGTVANGWARLISNAICLTARPVIWRALVNPVNAPASSVTQHIVGFASITNGVISTTGYYVVFYYIGTLGTNWHAYARSLTLVTDLDTGVNVASNLNTWFDLKIVATQTSVGFYINGTSVGTITTNLPPNNIPIFGSVFIANSTDTTNRSLYVDTVEIDIDTGVAGRFIKTEL